jgi:hypothetical protein
MSLLAADLVHNTRVALDHVLVRLKDHFSGDGRSRPGTTKVKSADSLGNPGQPLENGINLVKAGAPVGARSRDARNGRPASVAGGGSEAIEVAAKLARVDLRRFRLVSHAPACRGAGGSDGNGSENPAVSDCVRGALDGACDLDA